MTKNTLSLNTAEEIKTFLDQDGESFIRIDHRSQTLLGRLLDSQYVSPFVHPKLGSFVTTEGFWHYITLEEPNELFRVINGHECRRLLKDLRSKNKARKVKSRHFLQQIMLANYLKIKTDPKLFNLFRTFKPDLPFEIYYYLTKSKSGMSVVRTPQDDVRIRNLTMLRSILIDNPNAEIWVPDSTDILERMTTNAKRAQGLI